MALTICKAWQQIRNYSIAFPGLRQEMEQLSGGQTVPQIFINDSPVGGYDDIAALDVNGELDKLLAEQAGS